MRYLLSLTLFFVYSVSFQACSQVSAGQQKEVSKQISTALGKGDISTMSTFFPVSVGIAILEKSPVYYSKPQAEVVLRKFFDDNKAQAFEVAHSGGRDGAEFTIGNLSTTKGPFRVTFFLKEIDGKVLIKNLIIDKK